MNYDITEIENLLKNISDLGADSVKDENLSTSGGMVDERGRKFASAGMLLGSSSDEDETDEDENDGEVFTSSEGSVCSDDSGGTDGDFIGIHVIDDVIRSLNPALRGSDEEGEGDENDSLLGILNECEAYEYEQEGNDGKIDDSDVLFTYSPSPHKNLSMATDTDTSKPVMSPKLRKRLREARSMTKETDKSKWSTRLNISRGSGVNYDGYGSSSSTEEGCTTTTTVLSSLDMDLDRTSIFGPVDRRKKGNKVRRKRAKDRPLPRVAGIENYYNTSHNNYRRRLIGGEGGNNNENGGGGNDENPSGGNNKEDKDNCSNNDSDKLVESLKMRYLGARRGIKRLMEIKKELEKEIESVKEANQESLLSRSAVSQVLSLPPPPSTSSVVKKQPATKPAASAVENKSNNTTMLLLKSDIDSLREQVAHQNRKIVSCVSTERSLTQSTREIYDGPGGVRSLQKALSEYRSQIDRMRDVEKVRGERLRLGRELGRMRREREEREEKEKEKEKENGNGFDEKDGDKKSKIVRCRDNLLANRTKNKKYIRQLQLSIARLKREIEEKRGQGIMKEQGGGVNGGISIDEEMRNLSEKQEFDIVMVVPPSSSSRRVVVPSRRRSTAPAATATAKATAPATAPATATATATAPATDDDETSDVDIEDDFERKYNRVYGRR